MRTLLQDVRYGIRMLWKARGFTFVAVLSLALGIGANTTIFSMVNGLLVRPLPYREAERLVIVAETKPKQGIEESSMSFPNVTDYKNRSRSFESFAAFNRRHFNLAGENEPERVQGLSTSANLFATLGVMPAAGRDFLPEEDLPGAPPVVIISDNLWRNRLGSDRNVIGKTLRLNGENHTVVGVMPVAFKFPEWAEVWTPFALSVDESERGSHYLNCIARLKSDVSIEAAEAELSSIARNLENQYPETNAGRGTMIQPLREDLIGNEFRVVLALLLGAVGFVLLIACANIANLLLARAGARGKEFAIRTALGASRGRIIRQSLTESVLVAVMGGALGVLVAVWSLDLLVAQIPEQLPFWMRFDIDARVLAFTFFVSVLTGILFGLAPALQVSKPDLQATLKEGGRSSTEGIRHNRLRSLLVVSEVALALVLLIGASLMVRSFLHLQQVEPGFDARGVLTMQLWVQGAQYKEGKRQTAFYERVIERLSTLPGVAAVGAVNVLPLNNDNYSSTSFTIEGREVAPGDEPNANNGIVAGQYFKAIGIPILRGRTFTAQDTEDAPRVCIVNETLARRFFPGEEAVGKRIKHGDELVTIVGVAGDVKQYELSQKPDDQLYFPHKQNPWATMSLVARTTTGDPTRLAAAARNEIWAIDREQPVYNVRTMERVIAESDAVWLQRLWGLLFGVLSGVALMLAIIGVYGVVSYSVSRRTHEIGIRMALGARGADVLRLVVGQGLILISIGIAVGLAGAFLITQALASLLYGVTTTDPLTFVFAPLALVIVALIASFIPARRATKVDPMVALRHE